MRWRKKLYDALSVRNLGVAKGTFAPVFAGLKFFYLNTLDYDWPLFTKKSPQATPRAVARRPQ